MFGNLITFAADNLYSNEPALTTTSSLAPINSVSETIPKESGEFFLAILSNLNYFLLAVSIYYSAILFMNFYYWRLYRSVDRLHHEAKGVKSIQDAWWIWFRYINVLLLVTLVVNYKEFGILIFAFLFYFVRLFVYKNYSTYANVIVVLEILALFLAIFTIRSDQNFMQIIFAMLFVVNSFWVKLRWDFVAVMESLSQGFGQIGWKNNWPTKAAKFAKSDKLKFTKTENGNYKFEISIFLTIVYFLIFIVTLASVISSGLS